MDCNCPNPTTLTEIIAESCGIDLGQIQKLGFQRSGFPFLLNDATAPADIKELSAWQALLTAPDDSKIVVTPFVGADPIITAGDAITTGGGDNSTLNGFEEVEGVNPSTFSTTFKSLSSTVEKALKTLMCEKNLVVYFFLKGGTIASSEVTVDEDYNGFSVQSMFVSDRSNAGFGTKDTVTMSFSLPSGYSDNLVVIQPNFNPLTDF